MDDYCKDIANEIERKGNDGNVRIFRAWQETWEKEKLGPKGDHVLEARMLRKYGGLSWRDCDNEDAKVNANPTMMHLDKKEETTSIVSWGATRVLTTTWTKICRMSCGSPMKQNPGFMI